MTSTQPSLTHADPLARRSLEVLRAGQSPSGAFVASPAFDVYRYAWLRDGAFCAHALDVVGEREAAARWHDWVSTSIEAHRSSIEAVTQRIAGGETPPPSAMPPARYTLDGALEPPEDDPWPNFQIDGYGMWLWSLEEHLSPAPLPERLARTVELVAAYLRETWRLKCFNCWEEFDGGVHASTLAAVLRGLEAAGRLLDDERWTAEAERIRVFMLDRLLDGGASGAAPTTTVSTAASSGSACPSACSRSMTRGSRRPSKRSAATSPAPTAASTATGATPTSAAANGCCSRARSPGTTR